MKHITLSTYRKDKYYPRVVRAVGKLLARADVVAPSEILIEMGNLSKKNYEAWRKGQVPYLERVFEGSLSKANRILRIIGFHVHDLNMVSRQMIYHQSRGKRKKSNTEVFQISWSKHWKGIFLALLLEPITAKETNSYKQRPAQTRRCSWPWLQRAYWESLNDSSQLPLPTLSSSPVNWPLSLGSNDSKAAIDAKSNHMNNMSQQKDCGY